MIPVVRTRKALVALVGSWRKSGLSVGFVNGRKRAPQRLRFCNFVRRWTKWKMN